MGSSSELSPPDKERCFDIDTYTNWCEGTAQYPGAGEGGLPEITYLALGLGEQGEIQGLIKKIVRGDEAFQLDEHGCLPLELRHDLALEIGDLLYYCCRLARAIGYDPSAVLFMNQDKLYLRNVRGTIKGHNRSDEK